MTTTPRAAGPRVGHVNGNHLWYGVNNGYDAAFNDTDEPGDEDNYCVAVVKKNEYDKLLTEARALAEAFEDFKLECIDHAKADSAIYRWREFLKSLGVEE